MNCNQDRVVRNTLLFSSAFAEACLLVRCLLKPKSKPKYWLYLNSHSEASKKNYTEKNTLVTKKLCIKF